ncbi:MAG: hypothetical protein ACI8XB_002644, partial [Patiriisocius sp.]
MNRCSSLQPYSNVKIPPLSSAVIKTDLIVL